MSVTRRPVENGHDCRCYGYLDAHHDSGYRQSFADYQATGQFTCEDWTYPHHETGARITVRYPRWRSPVGRPGGTHRDPDTLHRRRAASPRVFNQVFA